MKQKLIILLILLLVFIGGANAEIPHCPIYINYDTSQSGCVLWSWSPGTTGNITDSYNVSVNFIWYNATTITSYNDIIGTGETSTIKIWAYNNTGSGNLSITFISGSQKALFTFSSIINVIQAIIPLFDSFGDLIVAIFPYMILVMFITGITVMVTHVLKIKKL